MTRRILVPTLPAWERSSGRSAARLKSISEVIPDPFLTRRRRRLSLDDHRPTVFTAKLPVMPPIGVLPIIQSSTITWRFHNYLYPKYASSDYSIVIL